MRCRITLTIIPNQVDYLPDANLNLKGRLLSYINDIIRGIPEADKPINITFQCSYDGSILDDTYSDNQVKFNQQINGKQFIYSIDGFAQTTSGDADFAHHYVIEFLSDTTTKKRNYLGIGGESLQYCLCSLHLFDSATVYTNSHGVHADNITNDVNGVATKYLVNYTDLAKSQKIRQTKPTTCVVNISRNGLRKELAHALDQPYILDIIGVYCDSESLNADKSHLKNYYVHKLETNGKLYVIHWKRIPFVSLGNTCCIAYQLQKHQLRVGRYPFDWLRYKNTKQLIDCLIDDFKGFTNITREKAPSGVFPIIDDEFPLDISKGANISKSIKCNLYGMIFPHDILDDVDRLKYLERIDRMRKLPLVDYVIDCAVSSTEANQLLTLLPNTRRLLILSEVDAAPSIAGDNKIYRVQLDTLHEKIHSVDTWKKDHLDFAKLFL